MMNAKKKNYISGHSMHVSLMYLFTPSEALYIET